MADGKRPKDSTLRRNVQSSQNRTSGERDIGTALRAVYESAVQEDIPAEMLDLLDKLR